MFCTPNRHDTDDTDDAKSKDLGANPKASREEHGEDRRVQSSAVSLYRVAWINGLVVACRHPPIACTNVIT